MNRLMHVTLLVLLALLLSTYLIGCGGSSNGSLAGIDGSGAPITSASGTVNGFGSVIVNGVRYHSDKAKILINDQLQTEDSLHTGYQVKVTGTLNTDGTGNATTIEFHPNLVGAITQIDLQKEQLTLLGQTVKITNTTVFDVAISPNYLDGLKVSDVILVSGHFDGSNMVTATRIELAPLKSHQIMGYVSNLNETNFTFTLNQLTINYSAASLTAFDNNRVKNGLLVSAAGTLDTNGVFQVQAMTHLQTDFSSEIKNADIEGIITRFSSSNDFDIAGIACGTNGQTTYENGAQINLMLGSSLKINGAINGSGQLVAKHIEFHLRVTNEIVGEVSNVSALIPGAINTGSFQISDAMIKTTATTAYEDNSDDNLRRFNFADIHDGNFVKVSGYSTPTEFIATKIARGKLDDQHELELRYEGLITNLEPHSFRIFGRSVVTTSTTEIKNITGESLTEAEFILLAPNQKVSVLGILKMGIFTATRVEIKAQDN